MEPIDFMRPIVDFISNNEELVQLTCSLCMLIVTIVYVVMTWKQAKYTKQSFLESVKQTREDRQPYIIPTINKVSGIAFDTSTSIRVQLSFQCNIENVGDSSAVSVYTFLYARMKSQKDSKSLVYAHLIPVYHYSIGVGKQESDDIHFETEQFRDIVEDLEISHVKNMKRIETDPSQRPYTGPGIILRVLYKNMMGQWFESELEQELLVLNHTGDGKGMVKNQDVANGDSYEGFMINPCYSRLRRQMVSEQYVKDVLKDCNKHAVTGVSMTELV